MPAHPRGAARHPRRRIVAGATCLLLSLAALTAFTSSARAADTTTTVTSSADTTVNSSTPTKATATSNSIGVYGSNPQATGLLRFVIPAAPVGKALTGATLKLRTSTIASAGSANVQNIRSAGDSWTEATATWNNRPALGTAILGTVPANSKANTSYSVPLNLAAWGTPSGSVSLAIQGTGTDSFWVWTREQTTAAYRPTLQLTWSDVGPPKDTTAPTAPSAPTASVDGSTVNLAWTASTDAVGVTGYTVHRSATAGFTPSASTAIGTTTSATTYADLNRPAGTWYYRVTARDAAGNTSAPSGTGAATIAPPPDTTKPSAPAALSASGTGSTINLSWTAATDDTAVTAYAVYRSTTDGFSPSSTTFVGNATATSYADPALTTGTYYYRVTASDAAGNTGDPSNQASATVADPPPPDTTKPSAPTEPGTTVSGSTVDLSWDASNDDTGVTGYTVYRSATDGFTPGDETKIGTSTTPHYSDSGRPTGTWYYRVTAFDAAANTSDPSDQISATVADPPPTTLTQTTDTADGYVNASEPSSVLSTSSSLSVYGTNPQMISYARFVIPTPDPGQTLTGVILRLRTSTIASAGTAAPITVRPAADTWTESGLTWNNRPAVTGPVIGTLPGGSAPDTAYTVPLDLSAWGNPTGSVTVALQNAAPTTPASSDSLWLWSRRHPTPTYRPTLLLTWTGSGSAGIPEPPTTNLDPLDPNATTTVTALGDIVCPPGDPVTDKTCKHPEVRSLINTINPGRLIMTGDLAQGLAPYSEFVAPGRFKDTYDDLRDEILPVLGNHEAYTPNAAGYWDYWYGPGVDNGRIGVRPYGWYTAAIGSWRFIGLDSECDAGGLAGGCDATSPQYQWLKAVLDNDTSQCTVVAYHKPRWTTGAGHPPDLALAPIWDLLASHHVDIVLNGHNHGAESFKPIGVSGTASQPVLQDDGTREFVDGIGGDSQYSFTSNGATPMNAVIARSTGTFGVLKLILKPGAYDWSYEPIAGSTFTDVAPATGSFSGSDTCH